MTATVLIVDDSLFMRTLLRRILLKNGYQIVGEAASGSETINLLKNLSPDIVMLDIILPDINGLDLIASIQSQSPASKIVICSAIGQEPVIRQAMENGAQAYLQKPFTPEQVVEAINI